MQALKSDQLDTVLAAAAKGDFFELTGDDQTALLDLVDSLSTEEQTDLLALVFLGQGEASDFGEASSKASALGDGIVDEVVNVSGLHAALEKGKSIANG